MMTRFQHAGLSIGAAFLLAACGGGGGGADTPTADTTAPVITLNGSNPMTVVTGLSYTEPGATAIDNVDGTVNVAASGTVDTTTAGTYTVTYTATDAAGNTATVTRTVNVVSTITHNGTTYGVVVSPHTGKVWLDRNLGAAQVCTASNDVACYGDYYQFGRNFDGHQDVQNSGTTTTLATSLANPGTAFITTATAPYDWVVGGVDDGAVQRAAEWSKTDGTSICPAGFRVPTFTEFTAENVNPSNVAGAFASFLKLPASGRRHGTSGNVEFNGNTIMMWTTSLTNAQIQATAQVQVYDTTSSGYTLSPFAYGMPIRCIAP